MRGGSHFAIGSQGAGDSARYLLGMTKTYQPLV
jgi:hypothetical protein